jgi:hypothetical protein
VQCWGRNQTAVGNGDSTTDVPLPAPAGSRSSGRLRGRGLPRVRHATDRTVRCWGATFADRSAMEPATVR